MKIVSNLKMSMVAMLIGVSMAASAQEIVPLKERGIILTPSRYTYTTDEVKEAIIDGGAHYKWKVESETPDTVRLILGGRNEKITLVVDVIYDAKSYNIKYVRSEGLNYDKDGTLSTTTSNISNYSPTTRGNGPMINHKYIRWTKNLAHGIDVELKEAKR